MVKATGIRLLTPEDQLAAPVEVKPLADYIGKIDALLQAELGDDDAGPSHDILIQVDLIPPHEAKTRLVASPGEVAHAKLSGVAKGLETSQDGDTRLGRRPRLPLTRERVVAGFAGFCAVWLASGALPLSSVIVASVLAPASLALWWWLDRIWQGLLQAAATAAGGCAVEIVLSRAGLFSHTHPDVFGVALWLPWIYVAASVGVGNVGRWLSPTLSGSPATPTEPRSTR